MSEKDNEELGDEWAAAMEEQATSGRGGTRGEAPKVDREANANREPYDSPKFPELNGQDYTASSATDGDELKLDVILDVPVTISMEIGRAKINIRNLLQLNQGSVVELDRLAGEPMDVLVNGTLIAHGEVVVVNDKFGIRLTDVISPSERVRKLA